MTGRTSTSYYRETAVLVIEFVWVWLFVFVCTCLGEENDGCISESSFSENSEYVTREFPF